MERLLYKENKSEKQPWAQETNYLLIIGIDDYKHPIPRLNNAVNDARAVKKVLLERYHGFSETNCTVLLNKTATKKRIMQAFDDLINKVSERDNLVVYFSGHGTFHKLTQRGYWIPFDGQWRERSSYLSNSEVIDFVKPLKAKHVFCLVDSCFSSALFRGEQQVNDRSWQLYQHPSRWLLSAGRLEPVSDGNLGENSPFTQSLVSHLTHNDEVLWVGDLCRQVLRNTVANSSTQVPRGEPLQNVGHMGGEFVFVPKDIAFQEIPEAIILNTNSPSNWWDTPKKLTAGLGFLAVLVIMIFVFNRPNPNVQLSESNAPSIPFSDSTDDTSNNAYEDTSLQEPPPEPPKERERNTASTQELKPEIPKDLIEIIGTPIALSRDSAFKEDQALPYARIVGAWEPDKRYLAEKGIKSACAFQIEFRLQAKEEIRIREMEVLVKKFDANIEGYYPDEYRAPMKIPVFYVPIRGKVGSNSQWFYIHDGIVKNHTTSPVIFTPDQNDARIVVRVEAFEPGIYTFDCYLHYTYQGLGGKMKIIENQKWLFNN